MVVLDSDLREEILLRLPLKSIIRFKAVSKQWRSLLESRSFTERRRMILSKLQKKPQFLAAADEYDHPTVVQPLEDGEEVEMFYLDCDFATRPSLSCDGVICIPVPGWVNVLNPSTGEFLRFSSGRDPPITRASSAAFYECFEIFPGYWRMGFGRDIVSGSYKIVRMFFEPNYYGHILDLDIGKWRKLKTPPPYFVREILKSACVNGSIFWLEIDICDNTQKILALDLHTEEFRDVPTPPSSCVSGQVTNLEDRLVVTTIDANDPHSKLTVWTMDSQEEAWSITYSFHLFPSTPSLFPAVVWYRCMPLSVSKRGNLFFCDREKRLKKYCPETGLICGLTDISSSVRVISPFVENLLPLRRRSDSLPEVRTFGFRKLNSSRISKFFRSIQLPSSSDILLCSAIALAAVVIVIVEVTVTADLQSKIKVIRVARNQ